MNISRRFGRKDLKMAHFDEKEGQLVMFNDYAMPKAAGGVMLAVTVVDFVRDLIAGFSRGIRISRTVRALMELDDRQLADIGLQRADIPEMTKAIVDGTEKEFFAARKVAKKAQTQDAAPELPLAA